MKIEVIFSGEQSFDALYRFGSGINPLFEAQLSQLMGGLVIALKDDYVNCRVEFILDDGERLEVRLISPVPTEKR